MNIEAVQEYARWKALLADKEEEVKSIKDKLAKLEPALIDEFADAQVRSLSVDAGNGSQTVYVQSQIWARNLKGADYTAQACKAAGLGAMVHETVSSQTLSSYLRDLEEAGAEIPEPLRDAVEPYKKFSVRVRKS